MHTLLSPSLASGSSSDHLNDLLPRSGVMLLSVYDDANKPGMAPGSLQGPIFFAISKPKPENYPRKLPEAQFYSFPSPTQEMVPGSLQRLIFNNFRAQARKWPQEASRDPCLAISEPKQRNGPRAQFYPLPSRSQEMAPGSLQRPMFSHF